MLRSDVPRAAIVGATSLVIHCATASAIGQRSVTGGEKHGAVFVRQEDRVDRDDIGCRAFAGAGDCRRKLEGRQVRPAASDRARLRCRTLASKIARLERSPAARAAVEVPAVATELVASRKAATQSKLAEKFRRAAPIRRRI